MIGAALREGYTLPLFIQGDHCQVNDKKYQADPEGEVGEVKKLIAEEVGAGFYNIDVDTSTLVDLSQPTLDEQQRLNYERAAEITAFIRELEPEGVTVSVGAEIGEVGMKNSTVEELHAFMQGYNRSLAALGRSRGHQQDLGADRHLARRRGAARRHHRRRQARSPGARGALPGGAGGVRPGRRGAARRQHASRRTPSATSRGSRPPRSTSPPTSRTSSSTIPRCPPTCGTGCGAGWTRTRPASGRAGTPTSSSTTRRARRRSGRSSGSSGRSREESATAIAADLERTFAFLFEQLNVNGTEDHVNRFVQAPMQHHAALKPALVAAEDDADAGE